MNVTILSAFRDATAYIDRYFTQIDSLACLLSKRGDSLSLVLGYGDSTDDTDAHLYEAACSRGVDVLLIEVSHGGPHFGSIEDPTRFKQLAYVGNEIWRCIQPSADIVGLVESDLIWQAEVLFSLIDEVGHLRTNLHKGFAAIAPMILDMPPAQTWYDTWAFRRDGVRFSKSPPYHKDMGPHNYFMQLDSAGSVLFMEGALARRLCWPEEDVIVGVCRQIHEHGGSVWLDRNAQVYHP